MIYLDMDGVSVDLDTALFKAWDRPNPWLELGRGDHPWVRELWGMNEAEFWKPIDALGVDFFVNLKAYPWFAALHSSLSTLGPVTFLTSPGFALHAPTGKTIWLRNWFGSNFVDFIITRKKQLLAKPGDVLIDDDQDWCAEFAKAGGASVLFPHVRNLAEPIPAGKSVAAEITDRVRRALNGPAGPGHVTPSSWVSPVNRTMPDFRIGAPVTVTWDLTNTAEPYGLSGRVAECSDNRLIIQRPPEKGARTLQFQALSWDPPQARWYLLDDGGLIDTKIINVRVTSP